MEAVYLKDVPLKIRQISNRLHRVKFQKKVFSELEFPMFNPLFYRRHADSEFGMQ